MSNWIRDRSTTCSGLSSSDSDNAESSPLLCPSHHKVELTN